MEQTEYLKERLEDQILWYDTKSSYHQNHYKRWKRMQIILTAFLPLSTGLIGRFQWFSIMFGIIGVLIACIEGVLALGKHHENWIEYRSICETLKHEKYMFLTKTGVYKEDEPFPYLVERVESIISKENINWASLHYENNNQKGDKPSGKKSVR